MARNLWRALSLASSSDSASEIRPTHSPHWGLWGTILWSIVISAFFVVLQVATIFVAVVSRSGRLTEADLMERLTSAVTDGYFISLSTFVTTVVCCGLIVGIVKLKRGSILREYLGIRAVPLKILMKWIGFLLGLVVLSDSIAVLLGRPIVPAFVSTAYATANPVWMIWVAVVIAAPLFEEAFFRGFLFKGLEASAIGPIGAVLVTASFWAAIHIQYDLYEVGTIFCLGLLIGAARVATASIVVPIALHSGASLVATIEAAILG